MEFEITNCEETSSSFNGIYTLKKLEHFDIIIDKKKPTGKTKLTLNCLVSILAACLAAFSMGATLGYSSPAGPKMTNGTFEHELVITAREKSWFDGIVSLGGLIGGSLIGTVVAFIGFKKSLICCSLVYISGWLFVCYANAVYILYIGRILTGCAAGMTTFLAPVYIAELSPPQIRGSLGTCFQFSVTLGVLFSYVAGAFLSWEWLAAANAFSPLILFIQMFFMPEVPRWLLSKRRKLDSFKSLIWLRRKDQNIEEELWKIELSISQEKKLSIKQFCQQIQEPKIYKPLLIILPIMMFQQFTGNNAIMFNTVELFKQTMPDMNSNLASIILVLCQVGILVVSIFLMDRLGRRTMLLISASLMTVATILFGLYYLPQIYSKPNTSWLPLSSLAIFVMSFSFGFGPIPLMIMAEIIPNNIRSIASGLSLLVSWICSFIVTTEFLDLKNALTSSGVFWLFGTCCFLSILFIWFFLPETKGKSLEDITKIFDKKLRKITEQ